MANEGSVWAGNGMVGQSLCGGGCPNISVGSGMDLAYRMTVWTLQSKRGVTLLEVVVAVTISLVVVMGALGLMQCLRRSYLETELAADASERVRIAMESLRHDLQRTGLGVDPDGADGRPDEVIEGAWAGALVARGDLDQFDASKKDDPEPWIAGLFPSTRTGNDEIYIYALRREDGGGGADLTFQADVAGGNIVTTPGGDQVAARDGIVDDVRLTRIAGAAGGSVGLGYVLYRGTLSNNANAWGTGNAVVWQPLADAITTLSFRYFDAQGLEISPPGGGDASMDLRRTIASIEVRLVALEKRADPMWKDSSDPNSQTASYRKAEGLERVMLRSPVGVTRADRQRPSV